MCSSKHYAAVDCGDQWSMESPHQRVPSGRWLGREPGPPDNDGISLRLGGDEHQFVILWDNGYVTVGTVGDCAPLLSRAVDVDDEPPTVVGANLRDGDRLGRAAQHGVARRREEVPAGTALAAGPQAPSAARPSPDGTPSKLDEPGSAAVSART
jgi:hypothetical protein